MTQFTYTKDMIFAEFKIAKDKDTKLGKGDDNKVFKNRVAMLKDMINLKKTMPQALEDVNINFENLLNAYIQTNPRDYFYYKVFGKSYEQHKIENEITDMSAYSDEDKNAQTLEEKVEAMV
jgi:hypothetical protein